MPNYPIDHPAMCDTCFCEKCFRGFYTALRDGLPTPSGDHKCLARGCPGTLRSHPTLWWKRIAPCKDGCLRLAAKA